MTTPRFLQIHTLHHYPAALLNRDDAGLAKRLPMGDAVRTRISSQCLKRHWRVAEDHHALSSLGVPMGDRSRRFADEIKKTLVQGGTASEELADVIASTLKDAFKKKLSELIKKAGKPDKKGKRAKQDTEAEPVEEREDDESKSTDQKQAIFLGRAEYSYLTRICNEVASAEKDVKKVGLALLQRLKDEEENIKAMRHGSGLESALFGRMVTSDVFASRDAAVYVSHAFTVHEQQVENDYFTVVDDLLHEAGEQGSAGIFDTELASGLYYGYVVVDVPQLVANLEGMKDLKECFTAAPEKRALAGRVVHHLLHLIATVSPGAKRGSTAPFDYASFMLVEAGDWQPRSLAGAFHNALPTKTPQLRAAAAGRIAEQIGQFDAAYGSALARRHLALDAVDIPNAQRLPLKALAEWAQEIITAGKAGA